MLSKVQQDGVGEVNSMSVREQECRCSAGSIQVENGHGHDGKLIQLACRHHGIHTIDLGEDALASIRTKGVVNQPECERKNCSHVAAAGCPCRTQ